MYDELTMQCIRYASYEYQVPQLIIMSVLKVEGGTPGMRKKNHGVSKKYEYDLGRSQFNISNLKEIQRFGISNAEQRILTDACYDIRVGAWWLKREIMACSTKISDPYASLWCGVGNYHTGANPKTERKIRQNKWYQSQVYKASLYIQKNYRWQ